MLDRSTIYKSTIDMNNKASPRVMAIDYMSIASPCVLDVGCACGDLGVALKEIKQATVYGFEYNPDSIKIAQETKSYAEINQLNLDNLTEADFPQYKQNFDYIVCGDVLEHLRYPAETLKILKNYLKDDGYIIASIPNVAHTSIKSNLLVDDFTYTPLGLLDETHIHLFTYKSIAEMLSEIGLKIEECNWTLQGKKAWQPNDPYPILSEDIKKFLFEDWHSFVCQYVVKLYPSRDKAEELLSYNLQKLSINEQNSPENIKKYRTQVLSELGELSEQKIANLTDIISHKEEKISSLNSSIESLKQSLLENENAQKSLQNEINQKDESLKKQEISLSQLNSTIKGLEQSLLDKEQEQNSLQEKISNQQNTIIEKEGCINNLESKISSMNSKIEGLQKNLSEKENAQKSLQNEINQKDESLKKQKTSLSQLNAEKEKLKQILSLQENRIIKLEKKLKKKKKKYIVAIFLCILIIFFLLMI